MLAFIAAWGESFTGRATLIARTRQLTSQAFLREDYETYCDEKIQTQWFMGPLCLFVCKNQY
ncbi:hypothetical protein CYJ36_14340 [Bacillus sp. UMB0893]|nr:hypothetical protein CYJ36_14340 [Bacillus sp. UMB0893]